MDISGCEYDPELWQRLSVTSRALAVLLVVLTAHSFRVMFWMEDLCDRGVGGGYAFCFSVYFVEVCAVLFVWLSVCACLLACVRARACACAVPVYLSESGLKFVHPYTSIFLNKYLTNFHNTKQRSRYIVAPFFPFLEGRREGSGCLSLRGWIRPRAVLMTSMRVTRGGWEGEGARGEGEGNYEA